jgi:hypothetical protein
MLMYKDDGGFRNVAEGEIEQATREGWIDGVPVRQRILAAKSGPIAKQEEPVTIETHEMPKQRGRPRKWGAPNQE